MVDVQQVLFHRVGVALAVPVHRVCPACRVQQVSGVGGDDGRGGPATCGEKTGAGNVPLYLSRCVCVCVCGRRDASHRAHTRTRTRTRARGHAVDVKKTGFRGGACVTDGANSRIARF